MIFSQTEKEEAKRLTEESSRAIRVLLASKSTRGRIVFDRTRSVYLLDGNILTLATIRKLLNDLERTAGSRARRVTEDYLNGRISLDEWKARLSDTIVASHWIAAGLALGGLSLAANNPTLEQDINAQKLYLTNFAQDVKQEKVSPARMKSRAASYMLALGITYWKVDLNEKKKLARLRETGLEIPEQRFGNPLLGVLGFNRSYTEARRIRRASESCDACIEYSDRWMLIEDMPPIGSLTCGSRCRCVIEFR